MLGVLLLGVAAAVGQADAAGPQELQQQVQDLVRLLDDEQLQRREAAEQALLELGPDILSLLPEITARTAAEQKVRLERIRQALEKQLAQSTAEASTVTLQGAMSVPEALTALEQQTGNRFVGTDREGSVAVDFKDEPFWSALDQVLDKAQLTIDPYSGETAALAIVARPEPQRNRHGVADYRGPFRFEAVRIEAVRDLRNPQVQGLRLLLEATWEPRVRPISLSQPLSDVTAADDQGRPIVIDGAQGTRTGSVESGIGSVELMIPLELPDRSARRIAVLSGTMTAMIPGRVESFRFTDLGEANEVPLRKAGVTVTLEGIRKNLDLFEVRMRVRFDDAANALESHRGWIFRNEAYVLDKNQKRIENLGSQTTRQEADEVGIAYLFEFQDPPSSYTFVYETPALIIQLPVPYELRDIDLP